MTDPIALADFFDDLIVQVGAKFFLPSVRQSSRTRGGDVLTASMGASLWQGSVVAVAAGRRDTAALQAQFEYLEETISPFLIHPTLICVPAYDPTGEILGSAVPVIQSLSSDDRHKLRLGGLPPGYRLRRGEMLGLTYGSDPTRYALHRIYTPTVTASGSGVTPQFTVVPHIRPGALVGARVTLHRPVCKALIVPGSIDWPSNSAIGQLGFSFIQTLR